MFFNAYVLVVINNSSSKLKEKQYKQKFSPKSYKTQIKIFGLIRLNQI